MKYIKILAVLITASAIPYSGCAFEDGNPWGWIDTEVTIEAVPSSGEVSLQSQQAVVESIRLLATGGAGGGSVSDFDPSDPPPGYSLCHNGHCHAADGSLVDYEDIIAGTGGAASGPRAVATRRIESEFSIDAQIVERLKIVEQTQITDAEVIIERLNLVGILDDGRDLEISLNLSSRPLDVPIRYDIGRYQPEEQDLVLVLSWPANLFDGLDFDDASTDNDGELIPVHGGRNRILYDELIARIEGSAELLWIED